MLDAQYIRENLAAVKANCENRKVNCDVDRVVQLDDERKRLAQETQQVQQRQNELSNQMKNVKDKAEREPLIAEGKALREKVTAFEAQGKKIADDLRAALSRSFPTSRIRTLPSATKTRSSAPGARRARSISRRRTTSPFAKRCSSPISRPGRPSPGRSSTSSRTRRCCSSWRSCSSP